MTNALIIAQILSSIVAIIKTIEARAEEAKANGEDVYTGEFKLELALQAIEAVYNTKQHSKPFEVVRASIVSTVSTLVAVYNALGLFKKKK
jgi:hypothetical protein